MSRGEREDVQKPGSLVITCPGIRGILLLNPCSPSCTVKNDPNPCPVPCYPKSSNQPQPTTAPPWNKTHHIIQTVLPQRFPRQHIQLIPRRPFRKHRTINRDLHPHKLTINEERREEKNIHDPVKLSYTPHSYPASVFQNVQS